MKQSRVVVMSSDNKRQIKYPKNCPLTWIYDLDKSIITPTLLRYTYKICILFYEQSINFVFLYRNLVYIVKMFDNESSTVNTWVNLFQGYSLQYVFGTDGSTTYAVVNYGVFYGEDSIDDCVKTVSKESPMII